MVRWGLWIGDIRVVVYLTGFMADMSVTKVELYVVNALVVCEDIRCELSVG